MERIPKMSNTDIFGQLFTKLNHSKDQIFPSDNANFLLTFKPKKLRFTINTTNCLITTSKFGSKLVRLG